MKIVMPILPKCSSYPNGYQRWEPNAGRCQLTAAVWMVTPDGHKVPGAYYCKSHADAIIKEYAEKLHENWSLLEIEER